MRHKILYMRYVNMTTENYKFDCPCVLNLFILCLVSFHLVSLNLESNFLKK
jgi:hypothetical protein